MKRVLFLISLLVCSLQFIVAEEFNVDGGDVEFDSPATRYTENSVLSTGDWYKIKVKESGVYRITYEQLRDWGIANPANVRVYGYGGAQLSEKNSDPYIDDLPQQNIYMSVGSDGVFGAGDYILFYAQGVVSWKYNEKTAVYDHINNTYSQFGYYFVTSSHGAGNRIQTRDAIVGDGTEITSYDALYIYDDDRNNLINSGKGFYSDELNLASPSYKSNISMPGLLGEDAKLKIEVAHNSLVKTTMSVKVNGAGISEMGILPESGKPHYVHAIVHENIIPFTPAAGNSLNLEFVYNNPTASVYLYHYLISAKCRLQKNGSTPLAFRNASYLAAEGNHTYRLNGYSTGSVVWDVTDKKNVFAVPVSHEGNDMLFVDSVNVLREYVAFNTSSDQFMSPELVGKIKNQDLHSLPLADMVIITHSDFMQDAKRLADVHAEHDGYTTHVVDAGLVYNEFSSGTPDATAYRRFMKMFYDRSTDDSAKPKYLLLFGDGSFDNRQILKSRTDKNIYRLLTYQAVNSVSEVASYCCDDYFGVLADNSTGNLVTDVMSIAVGRIPVYTKEQAAEVVNKIISYIRNEDLDVWKNRAIFIGDDGDGGEHMAAANDVCKLMENRYPNLLVRRMFFDSYVQEVTATGEQYPLLKKEFNDYINKGVLIVNYSGHGSYVGWSNEQILTTDDMLNMYNERLPLWITATCDFSRFDDYKDSGGELLMVNPKGGGIGLITSTRTVISSKNRMFNNELSKYILARNSNGELNSMAEAVRLAKNRRQLASDDNRLNFTYLGDPAVRLNYPIGCNVVLDSINGMEADTVGALDVVRIKGHIETDEVVDELFNGFVHITLYDKVDTLTTLCNDNGSKPFVYTALTSVIYSGRAEVNNGKFEAEFLLPLDIRYDFGAGRFVLYAADSERGIDGNGRSTALVIGGENPDMELEKDGPVVNAYINSPSFVNGQKVDENPLFVANISDISGINTIGTGIGHDIVLKLNNNPKFEYVLNDYFEAAIGSSSDGTVVFPFTNLEAGVYDLQFRVWDLQNNATTTSLQFEVVPGLNISAVSAMVYPNPAVDEVNLVVEHDKPLQPVDIEVFIYDLSGRMVRRDSKALVADGSGYITYKCKLDGSDGGALANGLFFMRAVLTDKNGNKDNITTKIIVNRRQ